MHNILVLIEVDLAMKIGNNTKTKSLQTSANFVLAILDKNNEVIVCCLESKSRLTYSAQQYVIA